MATRKKSTPQEAANQLLKDMGITKPYVPVEKIAAQLNAQVTYSPMDDELSGVIFIKDGHPVIGVNSLHHPNRQRFTIAHEIGHLILHSDMITSEVHVDRHGAMLMRDSVSKKGTNKVEIEANQFAAELLMPKSLLVSSLRKSASTDEDGIFDEIAKEFKVSRQALEHRVGALISILS